MTFCAVYYKAIHFHNNIATPYPLHAIVSLNKMSHADLIEGFCSITGASKEHVSPAGP
jgi:hypothetical protein